MASSRITDDDLWPDNATRAGIKLSRILVQLATRVRSTAAAGYAAGPVEGMGASWRGPVNLVQHCGTEPADRISARIARLNACDRMTVAGSTEHVPSTDRVCFNAVAETDGR